MNIPIDILLVQFYSYNMNASMKSLSLVISFARMFKKMSSINVSTIYSPAVVETSIITHELCLREEINPLEIQNEKLVYTNTKNLLLGIFVLLLFAIPGAWVGPIIMSLPAKDVIIKSLWRTQGNLVILIPITILLYTWQKDQMSFKRDHSPKMLLNSLMIAFFSFIWYICFVISWSMTITSHAMVLSSSYWFYIFAFTLIMGFSIHKYEYLGYILFAFGIVMLLTDPFARKENRVENQFLGDIVAFTGALSWSIQGVLSSRNYKLIHPLILSTHCTFIFVIFQLIIASAMVGPRVVFSFNQDYGAFGWLSDSSTILYVLFVVAPLFGVVNNAWFNISYFFWPMEIIAGATLTQPFLSQIAGVLMGQDKLPGFRTFFGLTLIMIGFLAAISGLRLKAVKEFEKLLKEEFNQSRIAMTSLQN